MGQVIFGMAVSLDGFVNDRDGKVSRLYPDMAAFDQTEVIQEAIRATGAVVMGRTTFDMGNGNYTGYEFDTPIFVITHHPPEPPGGETENRKFHFVTDGIESAFAGARAAAGDKDVTVVGGPTIGQKALKLGLIDILEVGIVPVFLGGGLRLFDTLEDGQVKLEQIKITETPGRLDIRYRVIK